MTGRHRSWNRRRLVRRARRFTLLATRRAKRRLGWPPSTVVVGQSWRPPDRGVAVIPLVHPDHRNVVDYDLVEAHLARTLTSLGSQTPTPLPAVVIGHRHPGFGDRFGRNVTFVSFGPDGPLHPSRLSRRTGVDPTALDKGVKMLVGRRLAASWVDPEIVFTIDADDLVVRDLFATVSECLRQLPRERGVLWTRGIELLCETRPGSGIEFLDAVEIRDFDRVCGSCRALRAAAFDDRMKAAADHFADLLDAVDALVPPDWDGGVLDADSSMAEALEAALSCVPPDALRWIARLGGHSWNHFSLRPIEYVGAAKVCGHGQHDGPRQGERHLELATAHLALRDTLARVGLAASDDPPTAR